MKTPLQKQRSSADTQGRFGNTELQSANGRFEQAVAGMEAARGLDLK